MIGKLGGRKVRFPERRRRRRQNAVALEEEEAESTASDHDARAAALTTLLISLFSSLMRGSLGSARRSSSRRAMRGRASRGTPLSNDFLMPAGMWCLEALTRIRLNTFSPLSQDDGDGTKSSRRSTSSLKSRQRASLKLTKDLVSRIGGMESRMVMSMGR